MKFEGKPFQICLKNMFLNNFVHVVTAISYTISQLITGRGGVARKWENPGSKTC